jgi:beta-phosphoglucomutase-like phosphatase (HAD superfamily)
MNACSHPPSHVAAVLFDFDETMIDLEPQHDAAHRALCRAMGSDYDALPESFRFSSGRRLIDDIREMRAHFGWNVPEEALWAIRHGAFLEQCRASRLELMPGVARVVRELHERGVRLAITTSAAADAIDEILRRFPIDADPGHSSRTLRDCFERIVDGSEVARGKPDPEAYLLTARRLGVDPRDCIVFEDSEAGVLAAKNAGMYCIAIPNPRARTRQDLRAADQVAGSFEEITVSSLIGR